MDVFTYIQNLPPETRQNPIGQLFPVALEQVVNAAVISEQAKTAKLDKDERVKKEMEIAKENIIRNVFVEKAIDEKITDERLKQAYEQYKAGFPEIAEVDAWHILVKDEAKAAELITKLESGADFETLARENSIDATAQKGGHVGWFGKDDVVPAFSKAAFALKDGEYTKAPVKTDFGYHVIKVAGHRNRPVPEFEQAKPFLAAQLRRVALDEIVQEWRAEADIERFDINGKPVEPAAANRPGL